jgi:glucose-1-phosphate cytidylyltransferase
MSDRARCSVQTVILCGGRGTRLRELSETLPKVLVEVGSRPIVWHVMKGYSESGFNEFILALGYLGDRIKQHFLDAEGWRGRDLRLRVGSQSAPELLGETEDSWTVVFADTGLDTNTGGRLIRARKYVRGDIFFATYGDGVADVDHQALLEFHKSHGRIATMTVVQPRLSFGLVDIDDEGRVARFREKPCLDSWVNGGFFVFDQRVFDYIAPDSVLEREPLERLAADGELVAYRHPGFWACMDTYKDNLELNESWATGSAPWRTW